MRPNIVSISLGENILRNIQPYKKIVNLLLSSRSYSSRAYFQSIGKEPLVYRNVGEQFLRSVEKYGQRPAVISCHDDKRLTFAQVGTEAEKLAVKLKELGLKRGDHLGVWAPNTTHWYVTFVAAALAGYPLVCINPALQARELEYALKKAKVRSLVTMDDCGRLNFYKTLKELLPHVRENSSAIAAENLPYLHSIVMTSTKPGKEFLNYEQLMTAPVDSEHIRRLLVELQEISPETPNNIQFTSGTTGQPKATLLTHFSQVNQGRIFGTYLGQDESNNRICLTVPLFHAFGMAVLMAALNYGSTLVIPSPIFNSVAALEAVEKEHCDLILGTPTMFVDFIENQKKLKKRLDSLKCGLVGGSPCSPEVYAKVKSEFGLRDLRIGYGLTETTSAIFSHSGTEDESEAHCTVGSLYEHAEAKVINDKGETVNFGESGELCVRGFYNMRGYFEEEATTEKVIYEDGWLKTGDEFILESSGVGRIVGRKKDVIIRGGENIFPKELEDFLDTHEDILEAQIIGVPDDRLGEEICAFLRLRPGVSQLTVNDLKLFCEGRLAHFKVPRYVCVVENFPKTTSGKIQKFKLKELFLENLDDLK